MSNKRTTIPNWRRVRLDEVCTVITSNVDKKSHKGEKPVRLCNYTDVYKNHNITLDLDFMQATATDKEIKKFALKVHDVIITKDSESPDDIANSACVLETNEDLLCGYHLAILRPNDDVYGPYLNYVLHQPKIRYAFSRQANGATRFGLTSSSYHQIEFFLPPLKEQKAIADLLATWDKAIDAITKLLTFKSKLLLGYTKILFNQTKIKNERFQQVKLGELFEEIKDKNINCKAKPYSITAGRGFISQHEKWGKDIAGKQFKNYICIKKGDFAYNKGNSKKYEYGCVYLSQENHICVPSSFICFRARNSHTLTELYSFYFLANLHARELKKYISSGARMDGLLNLNNNDLFKIHIPQFPIKLQKKISYLLSNLQSSQERLNFYLEKIKLQKKALTHRLLTEDLYQNNYRTSK